MSTRLTPPTPIFLALALLVGVVVGWLDVTQTKVEMIVVGIAASAFLLSYAHPHRAWLWATIIGGSVFTAHILAGWMQWPYTPEPLLTTLTALIPAFLGAYLAVMVNWSLQQAEAEAKQKQGGFAGTRRNV